MRTIQNIQSTELKPNGETWVRFISGEVWAHGPDGWRCVLGHCGAEVCK